MSNLWVTYLPSLTLALSQANSTRHRALMDMMGGVLEVKKEDILRMVRFPTSLSKVELGDEDYLQLTNFVYMNLSFKVLQQRVNNLQYLINTPHQANKILGTTDLPFNLTKRANKQKQATIVFWSH